MLCSLLCLVLITGCGTETTGPSGSDDLTLVMSVTSEASNGYDVAMWRPGMTAPRVIVQNAMIRSAPVRNTICYIRWNGDSSTVIVANLDGSNPRLVLATDVRIRHAALSYDASYVAVTYHQTEGSESGYACSIVPVAGGAPVRVSRFTGWENAVHWSPTQNILAFLASDAGISGPDTLMLINADGSGRRALSMNVPSIPDDSDLWRWRSDGAGILFTDYNDAYQIKFIDAATAAETVVVQDPTYPAISVAGGRRVATDYYFSTGDLSEPQESLAGVLAKFTGAGSQVQAIDTIEVGRFPIYLDVSSGDDFLSYVTVELNQGPGDPDINRSPIMVRDLRSGQVIDLHVRGSKPYWSR